MFLFQIYKDQIAVYFGTENSICFFREHLDRVKLELDNQNMRFDVKIEDIQSLIDDQLNGQRDARVGGYNYNIYHPYEDVRINFKA